MKLSRYERLVLSNQYRLLEALYPGEADYYSRHRKAVEEGYALNYRWLTEHLYEELSEEACREVLDVLDMYRAITFSIRDSEGTGIDSKTFFPFPGFDGNNEAQELSYVHYFLTDLGRFEELRPPSPGSNLNSHCPMLPKYRGMLRVWKSLGDPHHLSQDEIAKILEAPPA